MAHDAPAGPMTGAAGAQPPTSLPAVPLFSVYSFPGEPAAVSTGVASSGGAGDGGSGNPADGAAAPARPQGLRPAPQFSLPVDVEHKAQRVALLSLRRPHMRAFHLSWLSFFASFFSTFAAAAVLPIVRDDLRLTATDIGNANIASMCGAIVSRVVMGTLVDLCGCRVGAALGLLLTAPATFCMALVNDAASFLAMRAVIGVSLSLFVVNQAWMSKMFAPALVASANALSAGWGNAGSGVSLLVMPAVTQGLVQAGVPQFMAWRWAFCVPGTFQLLMGVAVLVLADDTPDGNMCMPYRQRCQSARQAVSSWRGALLNYRTWLLALAYGCCFGVELTVDNVLASYLYDQFSLSLTQAGLIGASFGLMNIFSRALGGLASDMGSHYGGMRGRLWVVWGGLVLAGIACLLLGLVSTSLEATVAVLVVFSLLVQAACGSVFGVVPFVARRCMGLMCGVVAGGANVGSIITQALFFGFVDFTTAQGFIWMGVMVLVLSGCVFFIHFPAWGSMLCPPTSGATEESYYLSEYTVAERAQGLHIGALKFSQGTRSERGPRRTPQDGATSTDAQEAGPGPFRVWRVIGLLPSRPSGDPSIDMRAHISGPASPRKRQLHERQLVVRLR